METTEDAFLGGRLKVLQPARGYRAGADPVFLAAAMMAARGETVLDLGCGVGVAMLCLKARLPEVEVTGVELQPDLAELARRNLEVNGLKGEVLTANAAALPKAFRSRTFVNVMTTPPFASGRPATASPPPCGICWRRWSWRCPYDEGRETGRGETMALADWVDVGLRRLKPGGTFGLVNRIERLPDCLSAISERVGDIRVLPLAARQGRKAKLFVLMGKKGAKGEMALLSPLVLHEGAAHDRDGESYTREAQTILRAGRSLGLGD